MSDLVVIYNELSRFGLRCVHLMRMGGPVDVDEARSQYLPALCEEIMRCAWEEKELGVHHLVLSWPVREVIRLERPEADPHPTLSLEGRGDGWAVMWWIGERSQLEEGGKATIREAVDLAGMLFQLRVGRAPMRALVRKLPKLPEGARSAGAPLMVPVEGVGDVELVEAGWAPAGFVVVE